MWVFWGLPSSYALYLFNETLKGGAFSRFLHLGNVFNPRGRSSLLLSSFFETVCPFPWSSSDPSGFWHSARPLTPTCFSKLGWLLLQGNICWFWKFKALCFFLFCINCHCGCGCVLSVSDLLKFTITRTGWATQSQLLIESACKSSKQASK